MLYNSRRKRKRVTVTLIGLRTIIVGRIIVVIGKVNYIG
jgi:hypothetical protein